MARTRTRAAKPAKDDDLEITDAKTPPRAKTRPPPAKRAATALKPARRAPRRGAATAVKPARPGRRRAANDSSGDESLDPFSPLLTRAQRRQRTMEQAAAAAEDDEVVIIDEEDEEDEDAFVDVGALRAEEKGGELTVQHAGAISVDEDDLEDSDGKSSNDEEAAADDDEEDEEDNGNKIESDDDDEEDEEEAETQEEKNGAAGAILATPRTTRSGLHLPDKKAASSDEEAASLSEDEEGEGEADDSVKASLATPRTTRNGTRIAPPAVESASSDEEAASSSENEEGESEVEDAVKAILATPRTTRNGTRIAPPAEEAKESDEEAASSSEDGEDEGEADDTVKAILATPRTTRNGTRIAPPAEEAASSSEDEEEETNATAEAILATPRTTRNGTPIAPRDEEEASNDSDEEEASDDSDEEEASDDADGSDSAVEEGGDLISQLIARNGAPSKAKDAESEDENEEQDEEEEQDESEEEEGDGDGDDDDDDEERELEMSLFGNLNAAKARKELEAVNSGAKAREMRDADIFVVDKGPGSASTEAEAGKKKSKKAATAAAWEDDDDIAVQVDLRKSSKARKLRDDREETLVDGKEYSKRLREQFRKMNRNTAWAELPSRKRARREAAGDSEDMDDDDDEAAEEMALLRSSEPLTRRASEFRRLPPGRLHLSRLNDANQHAPSKAVVQSVVWHKQGQLLATAGYDKTVRIFKVDGKVNARVESVYLRDMPIFNAQFAGRNHEQLICVGRRRFFYWLDLESGSVGKVPSIMGRPERSLESMAVAPDGSLLAFMGYDGNVILVSQESKQWVANVKMNENASCAAFTEDGRYLYTGGDHGRVYCWDMRTRRILFRFQDQGSTWTRSLAVTSSNDRLAIGSSNGVVNLYEVDAAARAGSLKGPEPTKAIMSLTTAVDQVTFNGDGQLLALMSRRKQDAVRLFNTNTLSVVQNWPTAKTPVHYASAVSFSPGSGMLALGNDRGRCLLYRLNHYKSAA